VGSVHATGHGIPDWYGYDMDEQVRTGPHPTRRAAAAALASAVTTE
jgi:hypothetical protein